ncbi:MAG TPA: hypothetical protein VHB02_17685 [Acidimicrobiales bacterium]|nr:hypothetical protein [Acidimicrobiales bacterium]
MPRAVMLVFAHPAGPDAEDEFNEWYDEVHLKDLLAVPGIVGATRYRLGDVQPGTASVTATTAPYLAIYEIEAEDVQATFAEIGKRAGTDQMRLSDAMSRSGDTAPVSLAYRLME